MSHTPLLSDAPVVSQPIAKSDSLLNYFVFIGCAIVVQVLLSVAVTLVILPSHSLQGELMQHNWYVWHGTAALRILYPAHVSHVW